MISFIIPTLNEEKVIEKLLLCLKGYSGAHEVIVSDGGSTDRTAELARMHADAVFVHSEKRRQTIAEGRNVGAHAARGEFLVFLDADVFIPEPDHFFTEALKLFDADQKMVALTAAVRVLPEFETFADKLIFSSLNVFHHLLNNKLGVGAAGGEFQMMRTSVFREIGGFNAALIASEDYDLFRKLSQKGRTGFAQNLTVYHTGRRAHKIGWPKLLSQWFLNTLSVLFFNKAASSEWKPIR